MPEKEVGVTAAPGVPSEDPADQEVEPCGRDMAASTPCHVLLRSAQMGWSRVEREVSKVVAQSGPVAHTPPCRAQPHKRGKAGWLPAC